MWVIVSARNNICLFDQMLAFMHVIKLQGLKRDDHERFSVLRKKEEGLQKVESWIHQEGFSNPFPTPAYRLNKHSNEKTMENMYMYLGG